MNGVPNQERNNYQSTSSKVRYESNQNLKFTIDTYFSQSLSPGRVFVSLVIFCVVLCTSCNFYQVYWDSVCSNSNNPGHGDADAAGQLGNYNILILFATHQQQ